jgi:hypothetical protein
MLLKSSLDGMPVTLALRPHSMTLGFDERVVAAWDTGGRLYSFIRDEGTCRRSLGGGILFKWQDGGKRWRLMEGGEADAILDETAALAERVRSAQRRPGWAWDPFPAPVDQARVDEVLARAARFGAVAAREDARAFWRLYEPIGMLPPDQYLSIVVQATHGCSFDTCAFCDLYHVGYSVKTPDAFRDHARAVLAWLGDSAALRQRAVFVGAANALAVPMPRLTGLLGALREVFDGTPPPLHAFVDGFTGARKDEHDYRVLAGLGLARVYVGLESGHDPLLAFVRKPGRAADAVAAAKAIKAAGIRLAVIVMTGLGGDRFAAAHVADTIEALAAMPLGPDDFVYVSQLIEQAGTPYPQLAADQGIRRLTPGECVAQRDEIARALRARFARPPRLATYDVREFVY